MVNGNGNGKTSTAARFLALPAQEVLDAAQAHSSKMENVRAKLAGARARKDQNTRGFGVLMKIKEMLGSCPDDRELGRRVRELLSAS